MRGRYNARPEISETLEQLVKNELAEGKKDAREGLLWLNRGLEFTRDAIKLMQADPQLKMPEAFRKAYDDTLATHHAWLVKKAVSVSAISIIFLV